ncbi:MAG TPA: cytochrome P450, partial [Solirubrobacteraceae bacterium]
TSPPAALSQPPSGQAAPATPRLPAGPRWPRIVQTLMVWRKLDAFERRWNHRYGDVFTIKALPWGTAVMIRDREMIKEIFTGDPAIFHAGEGNDLLAPVLGNQSVLVLDDEEHMRTRKRLLAPFHGEAVRVYGQAVEEIAREEIARWPIGEPFALHPRMRAITLEVILRTVIGVEEPERLTQLRRVLPDTVDIKLWTMAMWTVPFLGHLGPWRRYKHTVRDAFALLDDEIARRRVAPDLEQRTDVLSLLVRAGEMDDSNLRDQIMSLLLAGHETTTTALAWAFERLLRTPRVLERARQAADEGDDAYLDAVAKEALRIRPVIPAVTRRLTRPVKIGGYHFPAGVTLLPMITLMHSSPELFANPREFRPERFLEAQGDTYSWIPFGGGRRRCIGAAFATLEMRVTLRTILSETELHAPDGRDEPVSNHHITLTPRYGARVIRTR